MAISARGWATPATGCSGRGEKGDYALGAESPHELPGFNYLISSGIVSVFGFSATTPW
jgi:hypothetical protein